MLISSLVLFLGACAPDRSSPVDAATTDSTTATQGTTAVAHDGGASSGTIVTLRSPDEIVADFGARMKRVPTTASAEIAAAAIREAYDGLVDPQLLDRWISSPSEAPGRAVSSPWPEKIEIASSSQKGRKATVTGSVVERTSTGVAGRLPVRIELRQVNEGWLISAVDLSARPSDQPDEDADSAVALVRDYYRAIDAREFRKAYAMWGESGPPEQTLEQFEAGFADTKSVRVETGSPSRVEAAAGSQYVEVPVTIIATKRNGSTERFAGTYTLRRSVVEGGSPEWRLYRGEIRVR